MIEIKRQDWTHDVTEHGSNVFIVRCPGCGNDICMPNHKIHDDGGLWPGTCCPRLACKFQGFMRLEGWVKRAE